jgi:hypothetical protein
VRLVLGTRARLCAALVFTAVGGRPIETAFLLYFQIDLTGEKNLNLRTSSRHWW